MKLCCLIGTSDEKSLYESQVSSAKKALKERGYAIITPTPIEIYSEIEHLSNKQRADITLSILKSADTIAVIPGSENKPISKLCLAYAEATGMLILDLSGPDNLAGWPVELAIDDIMHKVNNGRIDIKAKDGMLQSTIYFENEHVAKTEEYVFPSCMKDIMKMLVHQSKQESTVRFTLVVNNEENADK